MTEVSGGSHSGVSVSEASRTDARLGELPVNRASFWRVRVRGAWIGEAGIDGQVEGLPFDDMSPVGDLSVLEETSHP